jgi:signal transduction histidine kinase
VACMLGWLCCALAAHPAYAQTSMRLDSADFVVSDAATPPESGWRRVALPDDWLHNHPALSGYAWYRVHFSMPARPSQPLVLYIPHLALIGEVRLNGSLLNPGVRFDAPDGQLGTTMIETPLFLVLPSGLFRVGDNVVEVRLQGSSLERSGLSRMWLAPPDQLRRTYLTRYTLQTIVPYVIVVLLVGALAFLMTYAWRQRRGYMMQIAALIAIPVVILYLAPPMLMTRSTLRAMRVFSTTAQYWLLCVAGYRLCQMRLRGLMPTLHVLTGASLLITLVWAIYGYIGDSVWMLTWPQLPIRFLIAGIIVYEGWKQRSVIHVALGVTAIFWTLTLVQSFLIPLDLLPWDSFRLSTAGALPFCVAMLFYFAQRFILDREESLIAQRAAIVTERERILQDMHDGMGAQLITALRMARREDADRTEVARSIEESLLDLRLIIDSLDLTEHDLLPLLGNLRFRLGPRLSALGIELVWDVEPLPRLDYLTSESALAILRIVQEALNNAIQHARPRSIRISVKPDNGGVAIQIVDDGQGFGGDGSHAGARGLAGMRQRAQKIGAQLEIVSSEHGTQVCLWLP